MIRRLGSAAIRLVMMLALAAFVRPVAARAGSCGMDGCPMDVRGHDSARQFSFDISYLTGNENRLEVGSHEAGAGEIAGHMVERLNRSSSTSLTARAQLFPRLSLSASLPWVDREHQHDVEHHANAGYYIPYRWSFSGLGDPAIVASVTPWSKAVTLQGGVKVPIGRRHVPSYYGVEPEPSVRPSTGSTDWLGGVQLHHALLGRSLRGDDVDLPLTLGLAGRVNGRGTDGYRVGNEASLNLAAAWPVHPAVSLMAQVNTRWQESDESGQPGVVAHETGGTSVLATPGVRFSFVPGLATYAYYQFRLYQHVNSLQLVSPYHFTFGTVYAFGS
jgi:hypothetical protein